MGLILAAGAAVGFGLYQALTRRALRGVGPMQSTLLQLWVGVICAGCLLAATPRFPLTAASLSRGALWFALAGLFNWGAGIALLSVSQQRIGAVKTAPVTATTPLFGILIAVPALGESPSLVAVIGTAVMVAGIGLASRTSSPCLHGRAVTSFSRLAPGLGTAFCWALSAIFVRRGVAHVDPLFGIWISLVTAAAVYAVAYAVVRDAKWHRVSRQVLGVELLAGIVVTLATWTFWLALSRADVGSVLALSLLQVPTAMLLAPLVGGRAGEEWTRRGFTTAGLVVAGAALVVVLG